MELPTITHLDLARQTPFERPVILEIASAQAPSPSALQTWGPHVLLTLGLAIIVWLLLRNLRKRAMLRPADETPRERIDDLRAEAAQRAHIESYSAEALELTERLAAMLDAKAAMIEKLIEDAQAVADRLERPVSQAGLSSLASAAKAVDQAESDPSQRLIHELADKGLPPAQIARQLGKPIGQVELVLALRRA